MAVSTGSYGAFVNYLFLQSLDSQITHAVLLDGSLTKISNTVAITWDSPTAYDGQELVMTSALVFTISSAGTVTYLRLEDSSKNLKATVNLTPVVYSTPTYYTLASLTIYHT